MSFSSGAVAEYLREERNKSRHPQNEHMNNFKIPPYHVHEQQFSKAFGLKANGYRYEHDIHNSDERMY